MEYEDVVKLSTAVDNIVDNYWEEAKCGFTLKYGVDIINEHMLDKWIKVCEDADMTNHVFYHLMILKRAYSNSITNANAPEEEIVEIPNKQCQECGFPYNDCLCPGDTYDY